MQYNTGEPPLDERTEATMWLNDNAYMAVTKLKDGTVVIYTAVADPGAGWQVGALKALKSSVEDACYSDKDKKDAK